MHMSRCARASVSAAGVASLLIICSGLARAAQPEGVERRGVMGGLSLGVGGVRQMGETPQGLVELEETTLGPGFGFHLGVMVSKRTALVLDSTSVATGLVVLSNHAGAVRYWVGRKAWIEAGVGTGLWIRGGHVTDPGFGLLTAAGWELKQTRGRAVDISLRYGTVAIGSARLSQLSVNLGLNWY